MAFRGIMIFSWFVLGFCFNGSANGQESGAGTFDQLEPKLKVYIESGEVENALTLIEDLLVISKKEDNQLQWVKTMIYKIELLRSIADLSQANELIEKVEESINQLDDEKTKARFYNRKAAVFFELKKREQALVAVEKSNALNESIRNKGIQFSNLNILGAIYRDNNQFKEATEVLKKLHTLSFNAKDTAEYLLSCYNLALSYFNEKSYNEVVEYGDKYFDYTQQQVNKKVDAHMYHCLAQSYFELSDYKLAYQYLDTAHLFRLRTLDKLVEDQVKEYRVRNELKIKKLENSLLIEQNQNGRIQRYVLLSFVVLSVLAILWFFFQRKRLRKLNGELQRLNDEMQKSLHFKTKLLGIVAHDIRNPMSGIIGITNLFANGLVAPQEMQELMVKLDSASKGVNLLLENLLNWVRSQGDGFSLELSEVSLKTILKSIEDEAQTLLLDKNIALRTFLDKAPEIIITDKNLLSLILRNLITNAIKFSNANAIIEIGYEKQGKYHQLIIKDHGVGMSEDAIAAIFSQNSKHSTRGTSNETGTGLGLGLCRDMVAELDGELKIHSELGQGTTVLVLLP